MLMIGSADAPTCTSKEVGTVTLDGIEFFSRKVEATIGFLLPVIFLWSDMLPLVMEEMEESNFRG